MLGIINTDICPGGAMEESSFVLIYYFTGQTAKEKRLRTSDQNLFQ